MITPCSSPLVRCLCAIVVVRILSGLSPLFSLASYCLCQKTHPMLYAKIDNKVAARCDKTMPVACTTFERMKCCLFLNTTRWAKKPNRTAKLNRIEPKKLNHNQQFWNQIETVRFGSWLTVRFGSVRFNGSVFFNEKLVMVWFKTIKLNRFNSLVQFDFKDK
jgi:hypothetical protein